MLRRIVTLVLLVAFVVTAMPLYAGGAAGAKPAKAAQKTVCEEKTPFQLIADTIKPGKGYAKNQVIPVPPEQVQVFQRVSDGIKEGSAKAKQCSLRTSK